MKAVSFFDGVWNCKKALRDFLQKLCYDEKNGDGGREYEMSVLWKRNGEG